MNRTAPISFLLVVGLALAGCGSKPFGIGPAAGPINPGAQALRLKAPAPATENFKKVDAKLYRGGEPNDEDMKALDHLGIKTVISLQSAFGAEKKVVDHEREVAADLGLKFVNLAMPFGKEPPAAMVEKYFAIFETKVDLPAYIHCKHGRDRTGTMVAIYRIRTEGITGEEALKDMKTYGFQPKAYPYFANFVLKFKATTPVN